jgi:hypothetical protein
MGLKLIGAHQLLIYADDENLLGENLDTIKKNKEKVIDASTKVSLKVNAEKSKYMLLSHYKNAGKNHDIKTANKSKATPVTGRAGL